MSAFGVRADIAGRAGNRLVDHPAGRDCFGDCLAQPSLARALRSAGPFLLRTPAIGGLQRGEGWISGVLAKAQSGALGLWWMGIF